MKTREDHIEFTLNYCEHYRPEPGRILDKAYTPCKKGLDISTVRVPNCSAPCIGGHKLENPTAICAHWQRRSREEAEKRADAIEAWHKRMAVVMLVVSQWRVKPKPKQDRREVIECPQCKGRLHLSQSSYNGHVHGKCETQGCVSWME